MSSIQLDVRTATNYYRLYEDKKNFAAEIIMNARDAMVFAQIRELPDDQTAAVTLLKEFLYILATNYGAKATLNISPGLLQKLPEGALQSTRGVGRYIAAAETQAAIQAVRNKKHVAAQLEKFATGEYKLLTKDELKTRSAELSEFKIKYSSFVSVEKIENGQYSAKAEQDKLNNPFVEHYAIEHDGKIIACVMHVMHGDKTYDADFVVHPDYRSKDIHPKDLKEEEKNYPRGLSQALSVQVYDHMSEKYKHLTGSWLIAGGYGGKGVGAHLYDEVFPTKTLQGDAALQHAVGIFLVFDNPGPEFLLAGNRDFATKRVNDDEKEYVQAALNILAQSTEPDLAAKQPQAVVVKPKEEIVPVSMFTHSANKPVKLDRNKFLNLRGHF
jgi:hypothetical protein